MRISDWSSACALPISATIELTELGQEQAGEVAASWTQAPALIVTSPYTRSRQTAAPTIARFPEVPAERWPIGEFNYLQPARWNGTRGAGRGAAPRTLLGARPTPPEIGRAPV